jgi:hypothetical protein
MIGKDSTTPPPTITNKPSPSEINAHMIPPKIPEINHAMKDNKKFNIPQVR